MDLVLPLLTDLLLVFRHLMVLLILLLVVELCDLQSQSNQQMEPAQEELLVHHNRMDLVL
jgi:hypothetical protein